MVYRTYFYCIESTLKAHCTGFCAPSTARKMLVTVVLWYLLLLLLYSITAVQSRTIVNNIAKTCSALLLMVYRTYFYCIESTLKAHCPLL